MPFFKICSVVRLVRVPVSCMHRESSQQYRMEFDRSSRFLSVGHHHCISCVEECLDREYFVIHSISVPTSRLGIPTEVSIL